MQSSRNSDLISDYMQYCRAHQNIIYNSLTDLRNINQRLADFITIETNSRNTNELLELSRELTRINRFIPQQVPPPRRPPPPSQPPSQPPHSVINSNRSSIIRPPVPQPPERPITITGRVSQQTSESQVNINETNNRSRRENSENRTGNRSTIVERPNLPISMRLLTPPLVSTASNFNFNGNINTTNNRRNRRNNRFFTFSNQQRHSLVNNRSNMSPVRIRPSTTQIRRGTDLLIWNDISDNYQTNCPIDMQDFRGNDSILRIRHCGHIFREMNLRRHFRNSTRCPLCRFDIRDYVEYDNLNERYDETDNNIENEGGVQNYSHTSLSNTIDEDIMDLIEEAVSNIELSDNQNNTSSTNN